MSQPLRHLLGIEDLSVQEIRSFLERGHRFKKEIAKGSRKFEELRGKTVVSLFYEASTRTRGSFEMAA
jgi:aspartate carbamoyltransferase catalytic subunit